MEKCSACGAPLSEGVCPYCGAGRQQAAVDGMGKTGSQPQVVVNNIGVQPGQGIDVPPKNKWVAFLLCLLLGYLGAHYFYVGKIGMGILYLLTLGLVGIGWIVDIVRILLDSFHDKYGRKLQA